jgi:hypothetical protein
MTRNTRIAIALAVVAQGAVGCDHETSRLPMAPTVLETARQPPASPAVYVLTSSSSTVVAGGALSVTWTASVGGSRDWIGLFRIGAANCDHGWSASTSGTTSGTLTLTAPTQSGQYEFRYLPDDGCDVAARSSAVTVVQEE